MKNPLKHIFCNRGQCGFRRESWNTETGTIK